MIISFLRELLELPSVDGKIVCLGGGVGTAQVLAGLRFYNHQLTAVVSMADDGGSAGRVRRAFALPPSGDIVNCLAALSSEESIVKKLFIYRFAGNRHGKDTDIAGQKLGNLIFVALTDIYKGDTNKALEEFSKIISSKGTVVPATLGDVNIWATTRDGKKVTGEQNINLWHYNGSKSLYDVHLEPENIRAYGPATKAIEDAKLIVVGPGDLFSTVLPVLIVKQIKKALLKSKAQKVFIVNIANKPFETNSFKASDYLETLSRHMGGDIFDKIFINTNQKPKIPAKIRYRYVSYDKENLGNYLPCIIEGDFIDVKYPIYHESGKIADKLVMLISSKKSPDFNLGMRADSS